ncbi:DUF3519 domain-containing protein [Helicobacter pylori]|uniref:DUF3519 domain-containing protein n=1 Tax=Helicobacter pylori TaxID=210 RepID=UPI000EAC48D7|nr:DUF3519 domain-containing protein [Helicobacter pylori]
MIAMRLQGFERDEKILRELETVAILSNDYRDGINYSISNLNDFDPMQKDLTSQENLLKIKNWRAKL